MPGSYKQKMPEDWDRLSELSAHITKWEQTPGAFTLVAAIQVVATKPS